MIALERSSGYPFHWQDPLGILQVLPMLEEVCFLREDGQAPLLPHISDGKVDLREIAGLLQGSTERPLALQMHLGTWNLVSLKSESRKLTLSHLRSITGREGTPSDPFLVRFLNGPDRRQGATPAQVPEASAQRVAALAQQPLKQPLKQLPSLNRLEEFLFGQPAPPNKLPLDADLLNRLRLSDPSVAAGFVANDGAARQLARLLSHSVEWQPSLGCEGLTADAVNQILINVLQGLDRLVGAERSLRITVQRGWGREAGQLQEGKKLPDGQLLGSYGQALLALWEERGSEHTIQEAAADLAAKAPAHVPGGVAFLVCLAAAGAQLQFFAVRGGGKACAPKPLGRAFDLGQNFDRAWVVLATANLYRLLTCFGASQTSQNRPADQLAQAMSAL